MTIPKTSNKIPSSSTQSKLSCVNCGDNLGDSSRRVYAFQSFINNAPARVFVEAAIKEIYRLNDPPDFKCQDELFAARQSPEGFLASCSSSSSAVRNGTTEGNDADLMEVYVGVNEAAIDEGLVSFYGADDSADEDDNFQGCPSPPSHPDDDVDQDDKSSKSEEEDEVEDAKFQMVLGAAVETGNESADPDYNPNESGSEDAEDEQQSKKPRRDGPDDQGLICSDCYKEFKTPKYFAQHRKTQHPGNPIYQCSVCQLILPSGFFLLRHVYEEHRSASQSQPRPQVAFKCSDCNLTYDTVSALGRHRREDHGDKDRPYKCHLCPVAFKQPQGLSSHIMFKHSGAPVPECKKCDIKFSNYRNLAST